MSTECGVRVTLRRDVSLMAKNNAMHQCARFDALDILPSEWTIMFPGSDTKLNCVLLLIPLFGVGSEI